MVLPNHTNPREEQEYRLFSLLSMLGHPINSQSVLVEGQLTQLANEIESKCLVLSDQANRFLSEFSSSNNLTTPISSLDREMQFPEDHREMLELEMVRIACELQNLIQTLLRQQLPILATGVERELNLALPPTGKRTSSLGPVESVDFFINGSNATICLFWLLEELPHALVVKTSDTQEIPNITPIDQLIEDIEGYSKRLVQFLPSLVRRATLPSSEDKDIKA